MVPCKRGINHGKVIEQIRRRPFARDDWQTVWQNLFRLHVRHSEGRRTFLDVSFNTVHILSYCTHWRRPSWVFSLARLDFAHFPTGWGDDIKMPALLCSGIEAPTFLRRRGRGRKKKKKDYTSNGIFLLHWSYQLLSSFSHAQNKIQGKRKDKGERKAKGKE